MQMPKQSHTFCHCEGAPRPWQSVISLYLTPPVSRPPGCALYSTARVSGKRKERQIAQKFFWKAGRERSAVLPRPGGLKWQWPGSSALRIWLSRINRHHSDRLAGPLTPFRRRDKPGSRCPVIQFECIIAQDMTYCNGETSVIRPDLTSPGAYLAKAQSRSLPVRSTPRCGLRHSWAP